MHRLRALSVSFDTHIHPWELPRFRGAVAHIAVFAYDRYHIRIDETGGYHQRYSLIQNKLNSFTGHYRPPIRF